MKYHQNTNKVHI